MTKKKVTKVTLSQLHEALEERQKPDRRKEDLGLPEGVTKERRVKNRRAAKPH